MEPMPRDPREVALSEVERIRAARRANPVLVVLVVLIVVVAGYLTLLGWHRPKTLGADGYQHGPYETWQVALLVVILAIVAGWCGWVGWSGLGTIVASVALTAMFGIDAGTNVDSDGLWPVDALLVATATVAGFLALSTMADRLHRPATNSARLHGNPLLRVVMAECLSLEAWIGCLFGGDRGVVMN